MPRPVRTLLIVVVLGLVGIVALTWMARRYASLSPQAPAGVEAPTAAVPAPPPETPAPAAAPSAAATPAPSEAHLREIDRFVAVRRALRKVLAESPKASKQIAEQLRGHEASQIKPLQFNLVFLLKYRVTREDAIVKQDWTFEGYRDVRADFLLWQGGTPPADPARAAAFETRREALGRAGLEGLEPLDQAADTGVSN